MAELVRVFPQVGQRMLRAYLNLSRLEQARKPEDVADLGPIEQVPRPWDVASVTDPQLRLEIWNWLDDVVDWLNSEYGWQLTDLVPACWPQHPHLVHDLGTLADQRRRAGLAFTSDALEDWQRYSLVYFVDRMKNRLKNSCDGAHRPAVGGSRVIAYRDEDARARREKLYRADVDTFPMPESSGRAVARFELVGESLVDRRTGEVPWQ